ncbi:MAG: translocation/assembly module TamB domain-containing protein [Pseudomonadota bacterium]
MRRLLPFCLTIIAGSALAQDENRDRGFLVGLIEDNISAPGLAVRIDGFEGALSSQASIDSLVVSDDGGPWLRLEDVVLDWNRSALLRGRLEVEELTAALISVDRPPLPPEGIELPEAEASGFSLPDLPVSIDIERLAAERIELGEPVLGRPIALALEASARLADGSGQANFQAQRIDAIQGSFSVEAAYAAETQRLTIDLDVAEAENGLVPGLLRLPGEPAIELQVSGDGPLDAFQADLALSSGGAERLGGAIILNGTEEGRRFDVNIGGDVTSLFAPRYQPFFGDDVSLRAVGLQAADGALALETLRIDTQALDVTGTVRIGADGWPNFLDVSGTLDAEDGGPVLLPTADSATLRSAGLSMRYDAELSDAWRLDLTLRDFEGQAAGLDAAALRASGAIRRENGQVASATAAIESTIDGLSFPDPSMAEALGQAIALTADVDWQQNSPLNIRDLTLRGSGYGLQGDVLADLTAETGLPISLDLAARIDALNQLSDLTGQDLSGSAVVDLSGVYDPVGGTFDLATEGVAQDLALNIPQVDALLSGQTRLTVEARRSPEGTFLDTLRLANNQVTADASAALRDGTPEEGETVPPSEAQLIARIVDGTLLDPRLDGPLTLETTLLRDPNAPWRGELALSAPQGIALSADGILTGNRPDLRFTAQVPDLSAFADGVPGSLSLDGRASATDGVWSIDANAAGPWNLSARVAGPVTGAQAAIAFEARLPELTAPAPALSEIEVLRGEVALDGTLRQEGGAWQLDTRLDAPAGISARLRGPVTGDAARIDLVATVPELSDFTAAVEGRLDLDASVFRSGEDWTAEARARGPYDSRVTVETVLTQTPLQVGFAAQLPELAPLVPAVPGGLDISGTARQANTGWQIQLVGTGPYDAAIEVFADLPETGPVVRANGRVPDASTLAPQLQGALDFTVDAEQIGTDWDVEALVSGAQGVRLSVAGTATGPDADLRIQLGAANVAPFVPALSGALDATARLYQDAERWAFDLDAAGPLGSDLTASGILTGQALEARFDLAVPDISPLVPDLSGPLRANGSVRQRDQDWALDLDLTGPAGTQATVSGTAGTGGDVNLSVNGSAPLGLANAALAPRRLSGVAAFDVRVNGPPSLNSLSGSITTQGATLVLPTLQNGLEDIDLTVNLSGSGARLNLTARPETGGRITVAGPIALNAPFNADLGIDFDVQLADPSLYTADVEGDLRVSGPLTGGATIQGGIVIEGAEIAVPSTGLTAIGDLPPINHINTPRPVRRTLARAGQDETETASGNGQDAAGPSYPLDIRLSAPGRIFIRGRGLDAELGGQLRLTGTTQNPVTAGGFELVRGRLDILQQRFDLDEGAINFQGDLTPNIRLVAATQTETLDAAIVIEGPADDIEVRFESSPDVPQEEILAQIFFGRDLSQLSPLQALQLANSVAVLAGRGSGGLLENLRGGAGLDDLDVTTDDQGNVALRAGKYVSDNVYTDVQIDQAGRAAISLNLDVTPNLTVRGSAGATGDTAVGLFYERDY